MASSLHNVELEAAKFLHKLIQDSTDEPAKLATKLHVILQHMKSSGKEHSMPFQVTSRAMETLISRHGLDLGTLRSTRGSLPGGPQTTDPASVQYAGSSQAVGVQKDSKVGLTQNEMTKVDPFSSNRLPVGPSITGHEYYQGAGTHRTSRSFDHESPSSLDTRSANSQSQDKQMNQNDSKKAANKRKRGDSSSPLEPNFDNTQQLDSRISVIDPRKGKMNKAEPSGPANYNVVPSCGQLEHFPSLAGNMRSMIRGRQDGQNITENLVNSSNISNMMSRAPNLKYPVEMEVSSTQNAPGQQQGVFPGGPDVFPSRGVWNQNKVGLPFDRPQLHRFSPNAVSGNMITEISTQQSTHASLSSGAFGKVQGGMPVSSNSYPTGEVALGLSKGFVTSPDGLSSTLSAGKALEHDGGSSNILPDANRIAQVARQNSVSEMTMLRATASRDTGKSPFSQSATFSSMPFNEHQLRQLRAQCLVFLAFRNGLMPKKLHLEIALGNTYPKEDGSRKELIDHIGKTQTSNEPSSISEVAMPFGRMNNAPPGSTSTARFLEGDSSLKEVKKLKMDERNGPPSDHSAILDERKHIIASQKAEAEIQSQGMVEPQAHLTTMSRKPESATSKGGFTITNPLDGMENDHLLVGKGDKVSHVMGANKLVSRDVLGWSGTGCHNEVSRASLPATAVQHDILVERRENGTSHFQNHEQDEEDRSVSTDSLPSSKQTMSEKWIMHVQKRKLLAEQKWVLKQNKTKQRIFVCFTKLKENVSSSEDISTKTKSVIELKKLQLLELQRRLRSGFLNDFFKPIVNDMERLKSYKKHRHGRRIKQLEKYEQKMKEERQKRIRERHKEFFSEIEVHKERLDDVFKIRRERWKGFNKYVKEFHKRKERIHREKIDKIQREKINLLKINDVEGYLRMVQDAKSDRVKQLLKETEKYLQKLGSKLQEAKTMASPFENDMDEMRTASVVENDITIENEDEAKHYMESNENYYMMAHSVKENITEQPAFLKGGKLREYQMNGLRWLVSLYNNHLNGILADEMGLGKTVQVISLICYLMETKNDRGPFLVVVPSSVLPGWESEINFWAPEIHSIVYSGPPEERRRLFKERIVHQKFNVLLTTYEYLMNKHDRPKLSKVHWHYIIIDEGHRIKNASCKLNADLKHYQSSHRLLLTGTPLQNNLEELWALLNFLLPNIFNSSEDFSQWFNKPFESNGDNSADEALLSEEENLLIINRLHQVLRPFVLRRLKHKVENQLPEKIERLIRCEASAYQKLLMKRVEENLGAIGNTKARSVHNTVMELRNICNHPYLSQLHVEEVDSLIPQHYLPPVIRLCGKLEMLDRLLPKLKATDHRVLFFSTMTRLLDVMEDYLTFKKYLYLRLDGHTCGNDRGALIEKFNQQGSPFFIFLLSIRAGGVGVNLQAADTVIIFDTDWNPQVDLQAQARAHRIGQKKDVLVLRFETVQTVEEQVRAAAEHKLGVANQSITAGFFDNNTSAEDRREYLESLLRECKKEEASPVLDNDSLNDILARSESEIEVFESVDKQRQEEEMATWKTLVLKSGLDGSKPLPPLPSRLVTDDDLKEFYEAMKLYDVPKTGVQPTVGVKRKGEKIGGLDTLQYGRGKRAREVRSYEEQWTEEEFEKICQVDSPESPKLKEEALERNFPKDASIGTVGGTQPPLCPAPLPPAQPLPVEPVYQPQQQNKDATPPSKRGRGRPRRATADKSPTAPVLPPSSATSKVDIGLQKGTESSSSSAPAPDLHSSIVVSQNLQPSTPTVSASESNPPGFSPSVQSKGQGQKAQTGGQAPRLRGRKQEPALSGAVDGISAPASKLSEESHDKSVDPPDCQAVGATGNVPGVSSIAISAPANLVPTAAIDCASRTTHPSDVGISLNSQLPPAPSAALIAQSIPSCPTAPVQVKGQGRKAQSGVGAPRRRGKKLAQLTAAALDVTAGQDSKFNPQALDKSADATLNNAIAMKGNHETDASDPSKVIKEQAKGSNAPVAVTGQEQHSTKHDSLSQSKLPESSQAVRDSTFKPLGTTVGQIQTADAHKKASVITEVSPECSSQMAKSSDVCGNQGEVLPVIPVTSQTSVEVVKKQIADNKVHASISTVKTASSDATAAMNCLPASNPIEGANITMPSAAAKIAPSSLPFPTYAPLASAPRSLLPHPAQSEQSKRPGRKAANRAEAPRRRGRKPATPDTSSGQDSKVNSQSQNKSMDLLVNKATVENSNQDSGPHELANVSQVYASEVHSTGALVGLDSKRKVASSVPAFTRIQTADVNNVARVMKEIFSETCSSKTKVGDAAGTEGRNAPAQSLSKTLDGIAKNQSVDDKTLINTPAHEKSSDCDIPIDKRKKQAETETGAKELENKTSLVVKALVERADSLKPECKMLTNSENVSYSGQIPSENSVKESHMEVESTSSLNSGGNKHASQGSPASSGDLLGSSVQPASTYPMDQPQTGEIDKRNMEPASEESPKVENTGDNCISVPSVSAMVESNLEVESAHPLNSDPNEDTSQRTAAPGGDHMGSSVQPDSQTGEIDKSNMESTFKKSPKVDNTGDNSIGVPSVSGVTGSNMDVESSCPLDSGGKKNTSQGTPASAGDQMGYIVQRDPSHLVDLPQTGDNDKSNIEHIFAGSPKADNAGDNCIGVPSVSGVARSVLEVESGCARNSGEKKDASQGTSTRGVDQIDSSVQPDSPCQMDLLQTAESDRCNIVPAFKDSPKADNTFDNFIEFPSVSGVLGPSLKNEAGPSLRGSPRASDESAVNLSALSFDKSDTPSVTLKCSNEITVVEGSENSDNLGATSVVEDIAAGCETVTGEAPNVKDQYDAGESKGDPVPERVKSVAIKSTDIESVPQGGSDLQPLVKDREGDCVEIHNMEVDVSETTVPVIKDFIAKPASSEPAPEVDKSDTPSVALKCSNEIAVVEGPEGSENSDNLGATSVVEDIAAGCETVNGEAPNVKVQSDPGESKGNPVPEPVKSVAIKSTDIESVPQSGLDLQPLVKDREGDCVEIHNMEVGAPETTVPVVKDFTAKSASSDPAPEVDKSDTPSVASKCSNEITVVEGTEGSENSDNLGATSVVEDIAAGCKTLTGEAPNVKGDPVPEPVKSVAVKSTDVESVPQGGLDLQQPLIKDREGDCVEIHNMEVEASETVPVVKDFTAKSASSEPAPEVDVQTPFDEVETAKDDNVEIFDAEIRTSERQSSEPAMPALGISVPVSDILQDNKIEKSRIDVDANESEKNPPVAVVTPVSQNASLVTYCMAVTSSEEMSYSRETCEISITESRMAVDCEVHHCREKEEFSSQESESPNGDNAELTVAPSCNQIELSVASPAANLNQNCCGNETNISSKDSPKISPCDTSNIESLVDPMNAGDAHNRSGAIPSTSALTEPNMCGSEVADFPGESAVTPAVIENNSYYEAEPCQDVSDTVESSPKSSALDFENHDSASMFRKSDVDDVPSPVTSNISPVQPGVMELPAITSNEFGKETEPSLDESIKHSGNERGSIVPLNISFLSHTLSDSSPEPSAALVAAETAAGDIHILREASDTVSRPSCASENKRDLESESQNLVSSKSTSIELMAKGDKLQLPSVVEWCDGNSVNVNNEEVDQSGQPNSSQKDFAVKSSTVGEVNFSLGTESVEGDSVNKDADHLEIEASVEKDIVDYSKMHPQVAVASTEDDTSEADATLSEATTNEPPDREQVLNDQSQELTRVEKTESDHVEASTSGLNPSEVQASPLQSGNSEDKELVEACNVELKPAEEPASLQAISDVSAKRELTHTDESKTKLSSDHGEACEQPKAASTDNSNREIDAPETDFCQQSKVENTDISMEIEPPDSKVPSPGVDRN